MAKILGIGGVFFKSKNPDELKKWYQETLWIESNDFASIFEWKDQSKIAWGITLWAPFQDSTDYFVPSEKEYMINFVVDNFDDFIETLEQKWISILSKMDEPQGKFAHILDPEGTKIELWEPTK